MAVKKATKKNVEVLSDGANTTEDKMQNVINVKEEVKEVKNDNNKKKYYYFNLPFTFKINELVGAEFNGHYKGEVIGDGAVKFLRVIHKDGSYGVIVPYNAIVGKFFLEEC